MERFSSLAFRFVPGSSPLVVFIHGLGADGCCFEGALQAAGLRGWALLIPDLVGFGLTPSEAGFSYDMQAQADRLAGLCRGLGAGEIAVVAHSMGGAVGVHLAEQWEAGVACFINAVGNLIPEDCFMSRSFVEMGLERFAARGFDAFRASVSQGEWGSVRPPSSYPRSLARTTAEAMFRSSESLVSLTDAGLLDRFTDLPCPKLYLHDSDHPLPEALRAGLGETHVPVVELPDSGHDLMEDNPAAFYRQLADFLDRNA